MKREHKFRLVYVLVLLAALSMVGLAVAVSEAGTVRFSWLPNEDEITSEYNIYCDQKTVAELDGQSHELWTTVTEEYLTEDGRITYNWEGLPEELTYHCVFVGIGLYEGKRVSSPFSPEVSFFIDTPPVPDIPRDGRVDFTISFR